MVLLAMALGCDGCPRPEDDLEPNDTLDEATRLEHAVPVEGRVVQDNADVFAFESDTQYIDQWTLVPRMHGMDENCVTFTMHAPDRTLLFEESFFECPGRTVGDADSQNGVTLRVRADGAYDLYVDVAVVGQRGDYYLTLIELAQSDNAFAFSWDYELTATHGQI